MTATRTRPNKRAASKRPGPRKRVAPKPTDKQVRDWAVASGIQGVQMRGRVSKHLVEEYAKAGGKVIEGQAKTTPVESQAKQPILGVGSVLARANDQERLAVYVVTSPNGERTILKPEGVYVEEISIDDTSMDTIIGSLGRLNGLPKSDQKIALVRGLTARLTELVSA